MTDSASTSRRAPPSSEDAVSSKMQKTHVTPPQRLRRQTIKDDLKVKYAGDEYDKCGTKGRPSNLTGNMYTLRADQNRPIFQYSVNFAPDDIKFSGLKDFLIKQCNLGLYHYNFNVVYLPHDTEKEFTRTAKRRDGSEVTITFKLIGQVHHNSAQMHGMMGNLVKWAISKMDMTAIGKGLYLLDSAVPIENYGLNVCAGYQTTVLPHEDEVLLTINMSNKVLNGSDANAYMRQVMRDSNNNKNALFDEIVGKTVLTKYNNKTYKIDDICFDMTPRSTFKRRNRETGEEEEISFMDYFKQQYNITIRDDKQPLLVSRKKKIDRRKGQEEESVISLIPETCTVCGIPEKLFTNFQFKKAMDNTIRKDPGTRSRLVGTFMKHFKNTKPYEEFKKWGFDVNEKPCNIPARKLDPFKVVFRDQSQTKDTTRPFDLRGVQMHDPGTPISRCVLISPQGCRENDDFKQKLQQVGRPLGLDIKIAKDCSYRSAADITEVLNRFKNMATKAQMIVVILRNQDKTLYDHIKKECCIEMGVPSQCLLQKHFRNPKGLLSVITKIAIQMGTKVGGVPWTIPFPPRDQFLICGMDTYHDSAKKGLSCVATVATLNNNFTKYAWSTSMVMHKQESNTLLRAQFGKLIKQFIRVNNSAPTKIIIFRDGVGEGQVPTIMEFEFAQIQQSIEELSPGAQVAFFTLSKRIETRFYEDGRNPSPGTVVDKVATHAGQKDFYLIPLESRQGSVTPICYRNHFNTLKLKADNFQYIAYMMSHMYYNWSGAIKVPSVCQYAHKLAFLVGTSLHKEPHQDLEDKLFFL